MRGPGRLIVFEGGEGSGKTTQLRRLSSRLESLAIVHVCLREPGGTPLGTEVRRVLLDRASDIEPRAEALLFMASRAQNVEREIRPALARGEVVLLDRFFLSTYAYQIGGHGLPENEVRNANRFATAGLTPDITILLSYPARDGLRRAGSRDLTHDRMEAMGESFHDRVEAALTRFRSTQWQADHPECGPIVAIDAAGSEADVEGRVVHALRDKWPDLG
ncbi:MAG: Thymidylate kinase [Gemmatimonadetes bacterium]|nr:Thymidylate kinase [Gemmatimonadota bacterium]